MELYKALVTISLFAPDERQKEFERVCEFPQYFVAVPGNSIAICKLDDGWILAEINEAIATPDYVRTEENVLEIDAQVEVSEKQEYTDLLNLLPRLGWKLNEDTE